MPKKLKVPDSLKFGSIVFPVWKLEDGRFAFDYKDGSSRIVKKRRSLEKLKTLASNIATDLLNGATAGEQITSEERRIYIAARDRLKPLGIEVDQGARLLADGIELAGSAEKVIEACRYFKSVQPATSQGTASVIAGTLVREKEMAGLSSVYTRKLSKDLEKFCNAFPGEISAIQPDEIATWLASREVSKRRRKNLRSSINLLFNFARERKFLPINLQTAVEQVTKIKVVLGRVSIYAPQEFSALIETAHDGYFCGVDLLPFIAIGGLAGVRSAEIERLDWMDIKLSRRVIEVRAINAKDARRRFVPIQDSLYSWLAPYADASGPVLRLPTRIDHLIEKLSEAAGVKWKRNGLRHSYGSYRTAQLGDIGRVSLEMGNSERMVRAHYLEAVHPEDATIWFSKSRDEAANVLRLALEFKK